MNGVSALTAAAARPVAPALDVAAAYVDHAAFIARIIQRLIGAGPHVDDLLQETFIVAFRRRAQFDGRAEVRTWLYAIAAHLCLHHRRSARRFSLFHGRLAQEGPRASSPAADEQLAHKQELGRAREVLEKLSFEQREVFVLYELEELEGREIAELLGVPVGTVWTRLAAARKKFTTLVRKRRLKEGVA
jgi:RNA polymerase sigma-70 factor, ECF subfamily